MMMGTLRDNDMGMQAKRLPKQFDNKNVEGLDGEGEDTTKMDS